MRKTAKIDLIAGGVVLAAAAGLVALLLIGGGSKPQTAQEAFNQTVAAADTREFFESIEQALSLDCDEWRFYSELMDRAEETHPELVARFENTLSSDLSFAELAILGSKMMAKENSCDSAADGPPVIEWSTDDGATVIERTENGLRVADVNEIVSAINQYIANHNFLPESWSEIAPFLDDGGSLQAYLGENINPPYSLNGSTPAKPGAFPVYTSLAEVPSPGMIHYDDPLANHMVVVLRQAGCNDDDSWPTPAGVREMAILYSLEGYAGISCQEV